MDITIPLWLLFVLIFMSGLSVLQVGIYVGIVGKLIFVFIQGLLKNDKVQQ